MSEDELEFESFADIDGFIAEQRGELMDLNHQMLQFSREGAREIEGYHARFEQICAQMYEAHAVGARMFADLTGDMIMDEFGLEKVDPEGDDDGEA